MTSTVLTFATPPLPEDPYWLTLEVATFDDRATLEDAAAAVDTLYDLDPCLATQEAAAAPEAADLPRVAAALDLALCKTLLSGDYEATVKVSRSHPDLAYTPVVSVGTITQTVRHDEPVILTLDMKEESSVVLPLPVMSGLQASWIGNVYSRAGRVAPPTINALHNVLFWSSSLTGTLRVQYNTTWDVLTVAVPGLKEGEDDPRGEKRASTLLVFYHFQTYAEGISPPPDDPTVDEAFLSEVCGWGSGSSFAGDDEEDEQPIAEPPLPEDPCREHFDLLGSYRPNGDDYYEDHCCQPPPFELGTCQEWVVGHVQAKGLDQATMEQYIAGHTGPVEFIAVGPHPENPEGCGEIVYKVEIEQGNCCDGIEPILWDDTISPEVMSNNSVAWIGVVGGAGPYRFKALSAGVYFKTDGGYHVQTIDSGWPIIRAYTSNICGTVRIQVTDQCSTVTGYIRATTGRWVDLPKVTCQPYPGANPAEAVMVEGTPSNSSWDYYWEDKVIRYGGRVYCTVQQTCSCLTFWPPTNLGIMQRACEGTKDGAFLGQTTDGIYYCAVPGYGWAAVDDFVVYVKQWVC